MPVPAQRADLEYGITNIASTTVIDRPAAGLGGEQPERTLMIRNCCSIRVPAGLRRAFCGPVQHGLHHGLICGARLSEFKAEVGALSSCLEHIAWKRLPATMTAWQGSITGMEVYAQQRPGYMGPPGPISTCQNRQTLALNLGRLPVPENSGGTPSPLDPANPG